jgi:hypothetical protein
MKPDEPQLFLSSANRYSNNQIRKTGIVPGASPSVANPQLDPTRALASFLVCDLATLEMPERPILFLTKCKKSVKKRLA